MSVSGGLEYKCFSAAKPFEPRYQRRVRVDLHEMLNTERVAAVEFRHFEREPVEHSFLLSDMMNFLLFTFFL